ncbi:hypothetical protein [Massilia sp. METH4]|uniref:hypothetical protein n=1 Tax=Massilia sp. METH4 TaxID=3123041 RepID=UPI0030CB358B
MKTLLTAITLATATVATASAGAAPPFHFQCIAGMSPHPHDGASPGAFDFIGGVDILDIHPAPPDFYPDPESTALPGLDLFGYPAPRDGVSGWTGADPEKYFSIDDGAMAGPPLSTGIVHGSEHQASGWNDERFIGLMDPTAGQGELLATNVIGGPAFAAAEPSGTALLGAGLLLPGGRQARRTVRKSRNFRKNKK